MREIKNNCEVVIPDNQIIKVDYQNIETLKNRVNSNTRKRIRLCAHKNIDDVLHEMLIVLTEDTYIRPHRHLGKSESFHIIEGLADIIIFDEDGNIIEIVTMGNYTSGRKFYYRLSDPYYHTLLILSDTLVFHETTNGPFKKSDTKFAAWAPDETDIIAGKKFLKQLIQNFKNDEEEKLQNDCYQH